MESQKERRKAKQRFYSQQWYEDNKTQRIAKQMQYYTENREKYLVYMKTYSKLYYRLHHPKKEKAPKIKPEKKVKEKKVPIPKPEKPKREKKVKSPKPVSVPAPVITPAFEKGVFTLSFD
jgi:hypothetical protein